MSAPLPPADLFSRQPILLDLPADTDLHRFYRTLYDPIYFDSSSSGRFNAPDASYGVLYAAQTISGAFAETFMREPGRTLLSEDLSRREVTFVFVTPGHSDLFALPAPGLGDWERPPRLFTMVCPTPFLRHGLLRCMAIERQSTASPIAGATTMMSFAMRSSIAPEMRYGRSPAIQAWTRIGSGRSPNLMASG